MIRRLIEFDFPIREVSAEAVREKNIRHGHISSLHIWWARRPLAASRTTAFAALVPDPATLLEPIPEYVDFLLDVLKSAPNENPGENAGIRARKRLLQFTAGLAPWEAMRDRKLIEKARRIIKVGKAVLDGLRGRELQEVIDGKREVAPPKVLDPFAGGGSIPLEALRLGCEVYASDYNPVAVLILKGVLEYPPKYSRPGSIDLPSTLPPCHSDDPPGTHPEILDMASVETTESPLVVAVRAWGQWVFTQAKKELERFYPPDPDGAVPVAYIWARTLPCQNPSCGTEIPLMRQTWLARTSDKKIALKMIPDLDRKYVDFQIVKDAEIDFDPAKGTVSRADVRCPVCGTVIKAPQTRRLFQTGQNGQRLVAVVVEHPKQGKLYRLPEKRDLEAYRAAEEALEKKRHELWAEWGLEPVPNELLPSIGVQQYGMTTWGHLFNARQKLALLTFAAAIRQVEKILTSSLAKDTAQAIITYLALGLSRMTDYLCTLARWNNPWEVIAQLFSRPALPMVWDYGEVVPLSSTVGSWESMFTRRGLAVLKELSHAYWPENIKVRVERGDAMTVSQRIAEIHALLTDPPYYDSIPYADLSDFFYVWLKRICGELYPSLFATPLTPKEQEIVQDATRRGGNEAAQRWFEEGLQRVFQEASQILTEEGIAVVVFAHKTTAAWEAVIGALLSADLYLVSSWPIHTEKETRLNALESAALASSIYMVCRKRTNTEIGEYPRVQEEIRQRVRERLSHFWEQGIRGADFFMSAIGPAVEAFGRYARVEKLSGEVVTVAELLEYVRRVVSEFALERILKNSQLGGVDAETRFYLLWRWTYNHNWLHFDEARKLAQGIGVELEKMWESGGLMEKKSEKVRILGPKEREKALQKRESFHTLIDALHKAVLLWESNNRQGLQEHLSQTYGANEIFWQIAQSISDVLPDGDKEKQLLQGLLYARRGLETGPAQKRLIES